MVNTILPYIAYKCYIISLEYNSADLLASASLLQVDFFSLVQHRVHVLVKSDDLTLDAQVRVFEEPDLHSRLGLEKLVDQKL